METAEKISYLLLSNYLFLLVTYSIVKIFRTELFRWLNLDDCLLLIFVLPLVVVGAVCPWLSLKIVIYIILLLASLLVWFDALLYDQYSMELNITSIFYFIRHPKSLFEESDFVWYLERKIGFYLLPVGMILYWYLAVFYPFGAKIWHVSLNTALFFIWALSVSKAKHKLRYVPVIIFLYVILFWLNNTFIFPIWTSLHYYYHLLIVGALILLYCILLVIKNWSPYVFFHTKSFIIQLFYEKKLRPRVVLTDEEMQATKFIQQSQQHSESFAQLSTSVKHIVLFAAESFSAVYRPQLNMPFLESLEQNSVTSKAHYAPCPNTERFIENLYYANYPINFSHSLLRNLTQAGFKTVYLTSDDTRRYALNQKIFEVGFDEILDENYLKSKSEKLFDYMMLSGIPKIGEIAKEQSIYLHIQNVSSHIPYVVVNDKKYNRHNSASRLGRYLNSLEEYDHICDLLLTELGKYINLEETLILYMGDHGESFGEYGYKCHSNATINNQVLVPFCMRHPKLTTSTFASSSHFMVLPTVLDLLGIEYQSKHAAVSGFSNPEQTPDLLYSQTVSGNVPANVALLKEKTKTMLDRTTHVNYLMDIDDDEIVKILSDVPLKKAQTLSYFMLKERGLLDIKY